MQNNNSNILLATILSIAVLISWTFFVEMPRVEKEQQMKEMAATSPDKKPKIQKSKPEAITNGSVEKKPVIELNQNREKLIKDSSDLRVKIENNNIIGSINLVGAKFDDLTLKKYFKSIDKEQNVVLLSPSKSKERYFSDFGWVSSDTKIDLPKPDTIWSADKSELKAGQSLNLSWQNREGVEFIIKISLDDNFLFDIKQIVKNNSSKDFTVASYGRVNRALPELQQAIFILHEGAIGVFNKVLEEVNYTNLMEEKNLSYSASNGGWFGITDKYWMATIIPDKGLEYDASFSYYDSSGVKFFNSEYVGQEFLVKAGQELEFKNHLYAGAKKVRLLDQYSKKYDIALFDRAVDFGWFYFLTKPFFFIIQLFNQFLGNFGLAILATTILIKLALFPMANKSYVAIGRIKKLQPKIEEIRANYKDDKMAMNKAMMEMYKREKVNPASGCLPAIIQIPVFFALYKVLFVTIDMRHAPFYGWIKDLSAADPTSIFNLFGLLPFEVSGFLNLGIWPLLMGITMIVQQKLNPPAADPTQAKILKWMPYIITIVLATFPAGLVIYWTWSNILSILQQWYITKRLQSKN